MTSTEIKSRLIEGAAVIYPGPYLNQLRGEKIETRCAELLAQGVQSLVISFRETELVNSIGISLLLGVFEVVDESGGTLILTDLSASNRELFEMLGILTRVRVMDTEERALAWLARPPETASLPAPDFPNQSAEHVETAEKAGNAEKAEKAMPKERR